MLDVRRLICVSAVVVGGLAQAGGQVQGGQVQGGQVQGGQVQGGQVQGGQVQGGQVQGGQVQGGQVQGTVISSPIERIGRWSGRHGGVSVDVYPYSGQLWMYKNGAWYSGAALVGLTVTGYAAQDLGLAPGEVGIWELRIDEAFPDPVQGLNMINASEAADLRSNSELWLYRVSKRPANTTTAWTSLCSVKYSDDPIHWWVETPDSRTATFVPGWWRQAQGYTYTTDSNIFSYACHDGVGTKCQRWGYKPYKWGYKNGSWVQFQELYSACVRAATADYCGEGISYTRNGTRVDVWDNYGFVLPVPEYQQPGYADESTFSSGGAECVELSRWDDIGRCGSTSTTTITPTYCPLINLNGVMRPDPSCQGYSTKPRVLTMQIYQEGQLSSCTRAGLPSSLIRVASSTWCPHDAATAGERLQKSCNDRTQCVCSYYPQCCAPESQGGYWTSTCAQFSSTCMSFGMLNTLH
ncbi:MAG: hypothetical protein IPJ65_29080 [Archangiaceae bacterium]|nr:hypothetical protein [Archangiaceae bacterium]